jgi:hypothetical protein
MKFERGEINIVFGQIPYIDPCWMYSIADKFRSAGKRSQLHYSTLIYQVSVPAAYLRADLGVPSMSSLSCPFSAGFFACTLKKAEIGGCAGSTAHFRFRLLVRQTGDCDGVRSPLAAALRCPVRCRCCETSGDCWLACVNAWCRWVIFGRWLPCCDRGLLRLWTPFWAEHRLILSLMIWISSSTCGFSLTDVPWLAFKVRSRLPLGTECFLSVKGVGWLG